MRKVFISFALIIFLSNTAFSSDSLHKEFKQFFRKFKHTKGWKITNNQKPILKTYFFNMADSTLAMYSIFDFSEKEHTRYFFTKNQLVWVFAYDHKPTKRISEFHRGIYRFENGRFLRKEENLYSINIEQLMEDAIKIIYESSAILSIESSKR